MNLKRSIWSGGLVAFTLLVALLVPNVVKAQTSAQGKFTLPFETRWGLATLPAGDYSFRMESSSSPQVIHIWGQEQTVLVTSAGISREKTAEHSALIIVRHGKRGTVRAFYLEHLGLTLNYFPPKAERQVVAEGPELIQKLPVLASAR